jgi:site-specific DNA recombinase
MKVIGYTRVSSDEQVNGFSLDAQEESIKRYCANNNHELISVYKEDFTGFKDFNRPQWNKITDYLKKNKSNVDVILCVRWDRFSRNEPEAKIQMSELKKKFNVDVVTIENYSDPNAIEGDFLNSIQLHMAMMESRRNSIRTKEGMRQGLKNGYWLYRAPFGYTSIKDNDDKPTLVIDPEKGKIVKEIFEKIGTGVYSCEEVRHQYKNITKGLSKSTFLTLLRKEVYMGKIKVLAYKDDPEIIVEGKHPPIVSEELFYRVQKILDGKKPNMKFHQNKDEIYPLKGFLYCEIHQKSITASRSKGRSKKHDYYHCTVGTCSNRFRLEQLDDKVKNLIGKLEVKTEVIELYKTILEDLFIKKQSIQQCDSKVIEKNINENKEKAKKIDRKFIDGQLSDENYNDLKTTLRNELKELELILNEKNNERIPYKKIINESTLILPELSKYYSSADGLTKKRILGSIFDGKIGVAEKEVRTAPWKEAIVSLFSIDKGFSDFENEKVGEIADFSYLAPPLRLERRTPSLTVMCSNQLS